MRYLPATCAALMFSALAGFVAPASAAVITDVVSGPVTVLSGAGNAFSYTHDISPPFNPATDTILGGTLTIEVSNPTADQQNFQVQFDAGDFVNEGAIPTSPPSTIYTFNVDGTLYGGVDLLADLQADGQLQVTLRMVGGPPGSSSFVFDQSTLEVTVAAIPEPASLFLIGSGLLGFAAVGRARRRRADV